MFLWGTDLDGTDVCRTYTQSLMHCYEVIPEGSVCKLYFDLEFHKPSNKEAEGKTMVSRLIQVRCFSNFHLIVIMGLESSWAGYFIQQRLLNLSDFFILPFFGKSKACFIRSLFPGFCVFSMFVKSWWRCLESHVPPATSWTLTRAQRRSSVDTSSSISKMQFLKTTYTWVRFKMATFFFPFFFLVPFWYEALKQYCLRHLGRFVHAILQPILSTLKGGRPHNGGVDDGDAWFVFVDQSYKPSLFLRHQHLGVSFFYFWNDSRGCDVPGGSPAEPSETRGSPQAKRRKEEEEQDLRFLLVKNKDGQDSLFVDLGKRNADTTFPHRAVCLFVFFTVLFTKTGVYTKNRNFRLYKSSKAGKRTVFTVAEDNTFHGQPGKVCWGKRVSGFLSLQRQVRSPHVVSPSSMLPAFELRASSVTQVKESSHGRSQEQRRTKPHGPNASRAQTRFRVTFLFLIFFNTVWHF